MSYSLHWVVVLVSSLLVILVPENGHAARKVALLIGNAQYNEAPLRNPANDVHVMAAALTSLDFTVIQRRDVNLPGMRAAVREFYRSLNDGDFGFFFFAGHGLQVQGENYLIPIGATIEEQYEVRSACYALHDLLEAMAQSGSNLNVVVLDCCRDNPFQRAWRRRSRTGRGLAPIGGVPDGTLIAFATAPGTTAADGRGNNSPYTEQLSKALHSHPAEGLELKDVFFRASRAVKIATGQRPWLNIEASLEDYYLRSPRNRSESSTASSAATSPQPTSPQPTAPQPAAPQLLSHRPRPLVAPFTRDAASSAQKVWAAHLKREPFITNSIGIQLALIPPGQFTMGSPSAEVGRTAGEQQHRVQITQPFDIGVYEITQSEYERIMQVNPSAFSQSGSRCDRVTAFDPSRFPVESVSWFDAREFCRRLTEVERASNQLDDDWSYQLPTEAQWEYACRAGTETMYYSGPTLTTTAAVSGGNLRKGQPRTVGSFEDNPFGLFDMHGNVSEWCLDWHNTGFYRSGVSIDPHGPLQGTYRVTRGGGWLCSVRLCRSAARAPLPPTDRNFNVGFRIVRVQSRITGNIATNLD